MITSVTLKNWKGISATIPLTGKDILAGPNGVGKSAVEEAISVALSGYTALGKKASSTMAMASENHTEVGISDGTHFLSRRFEWSKASATQTITFDGKVVKESDLSEILPESFRVPVEAIHPAEFLALSGEKRATWLFGNIGQTSEKIDPATIPAKPVWFKLPMDANDLLVALSKESGTTEDEIKKCVANLQRLMGTSEDLPKGTLKSWEETLTQVEKDIEAIAAERAKNEERTALAISRNQLRRKLEDQIAQTEKKITETKNKIDGIRTSVGNPDMDISTLPAMSEKLQTSIQKKRDIEAKATACRAKIKLFREKGTCPTCGANAEILQEIIEALDLEATTAEMDLETITDELAVLDLSVTELMEEKVLRERSKDAELEKKVLLDAVKSYQKTLAKDQESLAKFNGESVAEPVSDSLLEGKLTGLKSTRENVKETIKKFQSASTIKTARADAETERQRLIQLQEDIKESIKIVQEVRNLELQSLTDKIMAPFTHAANIAFSCDPYIRIVDEKGKADVDFGIIREGKKISFDTLSGGQRLVILVALVGALQIAKIGQPKLVMVEMSEADDVRFTAVTNVCNAIGFEQVVLSSHRAWAGEGWNIINMEEY